MRNSNAIPRSKFEKACVTYLNRARSETNYIATRFVTIYTVNCCISQTYIIVLLVKHIIINCLRKYIFSLIGRLLACDSSFVLLYSLLTRGEPFHAQSEWQATDLQPWRGNHFRHCLICTSGSVWNHRKCCCQGSQLLFRIAPTEAPRRGAIISRAPIGCSCAECVRSCAGNENICAAFCRRMCRL